MRIATVSSGRTVPAAPLGFACALGLALGLGASGCAAGLDGDAASGESVLVVVNKSANSISLVDPETLAETSRVATGNSPHEVAVSSDGRFAYVTDYGTGPEPGSTITVVDLEAGERIGTFSLGDHTRPHGVDIADDGSVWVTTEGSRHALRVDPASGRILQEIETGQQTTHMVVVVDEHSRIFTANIGSGTVTVADTRTGGVIAQLETGAGAEGIDVSPDAAFVYVTNRSAGTLTEIDAARAEVTRTLEVGDFPIRVRVHPNGRQALVSNAQANEVAVVDLEGWQVTRRIPVGAMPVGILISPDGRTAFVANTSDDRISVLDLETWQISGEITAGDEPDGMAWAVR